MSKIKTAFFLLKDPDKFGEVFLGKIEERFLGPIKSAKYAVFNCAEILNNKWQDATGLGSKDRIRFKPYFRDKAKARAIIYSSYFGLPGTLASTNYYSNWLSGFREAGVDAFVLAPMTKTRPVHGTGFVSGPLLIAPFKQFKFEVKKIIEKISPDFLLFHNDPDSLLAASALKNDGIFKVMFIGDAMTHRIKDDQARLRQIEGIIREFDAIIVVSEFLKEAWVNYGFDREKVFVTKTPVDAKSWPGHVGSNSGARAAYFGNIYHQEIENLLEISQIVVESYPSFKLDIYGDGQLEDMYKLKEKIRSMGLTSAVSLSESVSVKEMRTIQSHVDLLLLPREKAEFSDAGFPNKVGEYLASGCPTVVTKISNLDKILRDKENVFLVEPNDNYKFASVVLEVIKNYDNSKKVGACGRRFIEEYASCKEVANDWLRWVGNVNNGQQ